MKYFAIPLAVLVACGCWSQSKEASAAIELSTFVNQSFTGPDPVQVRLLGDNASAGQGQTYGNVSGGGEFRVETFNKTTSAWQSVVYTPVDSTLNQTNVVGSFIWKTFCIEYGEALVMGKTYNATIDDAAYYGTNLRPGSSSPEPLLDATKLLYGLYVEGRLDDAVVGFNYFDDAWVDALQQTLWNFEDTTAFSGTQVAALTNFAVANAANLASFGLQGEIKVLNLWDGELYTTSTSGQSQLAYVPGSTPPNDPPPAVPEPATLAVWSVLAGIGLVVSRRRRVVAE